MNETEVVKRTHSFLKEESLGRWKAARLFTDAHGSLLPHRSLAPFQRFTLDMGDFVLHPDIVGQLDDGETIFAIEAKGETDLIKGIAQAEMYQIGFHISFLASDTTALGPRLIDYARAKNIGVIAVSDNVQIAHLPVAHTPLRDAYQFLARQMDSVIQVSAGQTFTYNIPTHYLVWAVALQPGRIYDLESLSDKVAGYPIPREWRSALRGAQKLGLVRILGTEVHLTTVGSAVKDVLATEIADWAQVHGVVAARNRSVTLAEYRPQAAAVLRLLLLQDPIVRLVVEGLQTFPNHTASFADLAIACDRLDHASAPIFFLNPESAARLSDNRGRINWANTTGEDYRSTTFYQYKSVLKHAGIITKRTLGGATARGYDPHTDIWELG